MSPRSKPSIPVPTLSAGSVTGPVLDRLEGVLAMMVDLHQKMLEHGARHREALRRADTAMIARCVAQQGADAAKFNELETLRNDLFMVMSRATAPKPVLPLGRAMHAVAPTPASAPLAPMTLSIIIERAGEKHRARLASLGATLRTLVGQVEKQRAVLRISTESLLSHMQGMLAQVTRSLSPTGTYSRPTAVPCGVQVTSNVDIFS